MEILTQLFQTFHITLVIKIGFLLLIGMYLIFTVFLVNQVRSLNKLVRIEHGHASALVYTTTILYSLATIVLFFVALAIL